MTDNMITVSYTHLDVYKIQDIMCVKGNGLHTGILLEADVAEADLIITTTQSDEINMLCCLTAKRLGAKHTICLLYTSSK